MLLQECFLHALQSKHNQRKLPYTRPGPDMCIIISVILPEASPIVKFGEDFFSFSPRTP